MYWYDNSMITNLLILPSGNIKYYKKQVNILLNKIKKGRN